MPTLVEPVHGGFDPGQFQIQSDELEANLEPHSGAEAPTESSLGRLSDGLSCSGHAIVCAESTLQLSVVEKAFELCMSVSTVSSVAAEVADTS